MKRKGRGRRYAGAAIVSLMAMLGAVGVPAAQQVGAVTTESSAMVVEWNGNAQAAIIGRAGQGPTV
ncbi:MAG: hypothetical protein ACRDJJ_03785, partial [Actinomycetota bacterium]